MQTFKKMMLACTSFILLLILFSVILIEPPIMAKTHYRHYETDMRRETAGIYDFLFMGDSDGLFAFYPQIFDENTGCKSLNLSGTDMTQGSEYYFIEKEIRRNPVKEVVLQVSYETFYKDPDDAKGEGDASSLERMDSVFERFVFLAKHVRINDWLNIYSRQLASGVSYWMTVLSGGEIKPYDGSKNRWENVNPKNISLDKEEALSLHNVEDMDREFREDRVKEVSAIIKMCNKNGVKVTLVVVPVADCKIWALDHLDTFEERLRVFAEENDVNVYDFNLCRDRYQHYSDAQSFTDEWHCSTKGAIDFSTAFSDVYNKIHCGESINDLFYENYDAMRADSPYQVYVTSDSK